MHNISDLLIKKEKTIKEALKQIDKGAKKIVFVVDHNNRLIGSISDGDIRRWILKNGNLSSNIKNVYNINPKFLEELTRRNLVATELHDSNSIAHLLDTNIKYVFINFIDRNNPNIQEPKYVLIQNEDNKIKLFYSADDLNRFHEKLSSRIIKITDPSDPNQKYIYMTNNAGTNWELQNIEDETERFPAELTGETLIKMQHDGNAEIKVTN